MYTDLFSPEKAAEAWQILQKEFASGVLETLYMTLLSTLFAFLIGLPLGILLAVSDKDGILPLPRGVKAFLNGLVNLLRSVPFLILMIMVLPLSYVIFGTQVGSVACLVPLTVAAFPFVARLVETSIREVDKNVVEAAKSMGASTFQTIWKVLLPEAVPSLVSNATLTVTTVLGYSAMSGIIGGGGLGQIAITYGYYRYRTLVMLISVAALIVIVEIFQYTGSFIAKKIDKRLK